jgi:hypothetical protein
MDIYSHVIPAQLQPVTTQAALQKEKGLINRVELRGLEPLTPTLPGRHDRVQGGSPSFRMRLEQRRNTSAYVYE